MQGLEDDGFGLGLQGVRAAAIYRGARPLGVRATKATAARGVAGSDSTGSPAPSRGRGRPRQAGSLCRWAAGGGGRDGLGRREKVGRWEEKESGAGRAGRERKKKLGRAKGFWAAGKKEKEREGERKLGRLG